MTRGEDFMWKRKCKNNHSSTISNWASCVLNSKRDFIKLHYPCQNPKCKCRKQITFTLRQVQLEGAGFKTRKENFFKRSQKSWKSFLEPTINTLAPGIGLAVGTKNKNHQVDQATTNILKSISGEKYLSSTIMYGRGLRLKVKCFLLHLGFL